MICAVTVLVVLSSLLALDVVAVRAMVRDRAGLPWWTALVLAASVGVAVGLWCGFWCQYWPSPNLQVFSFPIPAGILHYRNGEFLEDLVPPDPLAVMLADALIIALLVPFPVAALYMAVRPWRRRALAKLDQTTGSGRR